MRVLFEKSHLEHGALICVQGVDFDQEESHDFFEVKAIQNIVRTPFQFVLSRLVGLELTNEFSFAHVIALTVSAFPIGCDGLPDRDFEKGKVMPFGSVLLFHRPFGQTKKYFLNHIIFVVVFDKPSDLNQAEVVNHLYAGRIVEILLEVIKVMVRDVHLPEPA